MNAKILFGVAGIVVGGMIVLLLNPAIQPRSMMFWGDNSSNPTSGRTVGVTNKIDEHFIEQMIPHHDGAIAMADMALFKATHPEVKVLAEAIIKAQKGEIKEMQSWYKDWFGKNVPEVSTFMMGGGMMSQKGMHMGGQEDVKALESAETFDKAFIEAMIPHHQLAVMMAQMLKSGTARPEMSTLADNIIESQSREIREMQGWYKNWYK